MLTAVFEAEGLFVKIPHLEYAAGTLGQLPVKEAKISRLALCDLY